MVKDIKVKRSCSRSKARVRKKLMEMGCTRCHWCKCKLDDSFYQHEGNRKYPTIEHIVALAEGGARGNCHDLSNLTLACVSCNQVRGRITSKKLLDKKKKRGSVKTCNTILKKIISLAQKCRTALQKLK